MPLPSRLREDLLRCCSDDDEIDELIDDVPADDSRSKDDNDSVCSFLTLKTGALARLGGFLLCVPLLMTLGKSFSSSPLPAESCGDFLFRLLGRNWPGFKN